MKSAIVGIVCKSASPDAYRKTGRGFAIISDEVRRAVLSVGLVPMAITSPKLQPGYGYNTSGSLTAAERQILKQQISLCDGLILQGGGRIDDFEYDVARYAYDEDVPTMGFCAGQTVMGRIMGAEVCDVDQFIHKCPYSDYAHSCAVVPGTLFGDIVKMSTLMVNSRHARAIATCDRLTISARDPDGHAEVIEAPDKICYLGMRFHPESLYRTDDKMQSIFRFFAHVVKAP